MPEPESARRQTVVALDVGSSSVRASLVDPALRMRGTQARYAWRTAREHVEIDARRLEQVVIGAIDGALQDRPAAAAVATAAFWHSLLGVDRHGTPVTPVIAWSDRRAAGEARSLRESLDERAVHQRTGCRFHAGYWPARLLWFRRHDRRTFDRVRRWTTFDAWLQERWLGADGIGVSQASATGLMDQRTCAWDTEVARTCRVDPDALGRILDTGWIDGELRPSLKRRWPALARARWLRAVGDGAANNVGAGCVTRSRVALMVGTSGAVRALWAPKPDEVIDLPFGLWRYRLDRRHVVVGGALSSGGNLREWILGTFEATRDTERRAARMTPDAHGLTWLPFLWGTRSPHYREDARGVLDGITAETTAADVLRAGMEAVAYGFASLLDLLEAGHPVRRIVAAGGALERSSAWTQILADVLGRPVLHSGARELTSRGTALLAWHRLGGSALAGVGLPGGRVLSPDRSRHRVYVGAMERQRQLMARVLDIDAAR